MDALNSSITRPSIIKDYSEENARTQLKEIKDIFISKVILPQNVLSNKKIFIKKIPRTPVVDEQTIFQTNQQDLCAKDIYNNLKIVNQFDSKSNTSRTIATFTSNEVSHTRTSDGVVRVIGQENYNTVFAAVCSLISSEFRYKAILALLTRPKTYRNISSQTESQPVKDFAEKSIMTEPPDDNTSKSKDKPIEQTSFKEYTPDITEPVILNRKRNNKRRPLPYVVHDPNQIKNQSLIEESYCLNSDKGFSDLQHLVKITNRIVIYPEELTNNGKLGTTFLDSIPDKTKPVDPKDNAVEEICLKNSELDNLNLTDNESNMDNISLTGFSIETAPLEVATQRLLDVSSKFTEKQTNIETEDNLDKTLNSKHTEIDELLTKAKVTHTKEYSAMKMNDVALWNDLTSHLPIKPEDHFHLATPEVLKNLPIVERQKLLFHQAYIDWKYCLHVEDNLLPIHQAVLNNDLELLRRQCLVLKARHQSIDIGDAEFNFSALQLAVVRQCNPECLHVLLGLGANPLEPDDEERTSLHHAAEAPTDEYINHMLDYITNHPRSIIDSCELWRAEMCDWPAEQLSMFIVQHACDMIDNRGYTPLMAASRLGHCDHVYALLNASSEDVNRGMPNTGNTALYLAVEAAFYDAIAKGDRSKISESYSKTIEQLIRFGADPSVENNSGATVTSIMHECHNTDFSIINKTLTAMTLMSTDCKSNSPNQALKDLEPFIIIRTSDGKVNYEKVKKKTLMPDEHSNPTVEIETQHDATKKSVRDLKRRNSEEGIEKKVIKQTVSNGKVKAIDIEINVNLKDRTDVKQRAATNIQTTTTQDKTDEEKPVNNKLKILRDITIPSHKDLIKAYTQIHPNKTGLMGSQHNSTINDVNDNMQDNTEIEQRAVANRQASMTQEKIIQGTPSNNKPKILNDIKISSYKNIVQGYKQNLNVFPNKLPNKTTFRESLHDSAVKDIFKQNNIDESLRKKAIEGTVCYKEVKVHDMEENINYQDSNMMKQMSVTNVQAPVTQEKTDQAKLINNKPKILKDVTLAPHRELLKAYKETLALLAEKEKKLHAASTNNKKITMENRVVKIMKQGEQFTMQSNSKMSSSNVKPIVVRHFVKVSPKSTKGVPLWESVKKANNTLLSVNDKEKLNLVDKSVKVKAPSFAHGIILSKPSRVEKIEKSTDLNDLQKLISLKAGSSMQSVTMKQVDDLVTLKRKVDNNSELPVKKIKKMNSQK